MRAYCLVSVLLLAAVPTKAQEPWNKDFSKWTREDLYWIHTKSPWIRRVIYPVGSALANQPSPGKGPWDHWREVDYLREFNDFPHPPGDVRFNDLQSVGGYLAPSGKNSPGPQRTSFVWVQWWSGRTLRRAWLRELQLSGRGGPEGELRQAENVATDQVEIRVMGEAFRLAPNNQEWLVNGAWLENSRLKRGVAPLSAEVLKDGMLRFLFPRRLDDGTPFLKSGDRVVFNWRTPARMRSFTNVPPVKVTFDLGKMTVAGQPDY